MYQKSSIKSGFFIFLCLIIFRFLFPAEGMIPLSEIKTLDLKKLGFQIDSQELYNPNGISLIDGIIKLNGCTASFVSSDGLLLTNYHCAFGAIQSITTKENDYLKNGFIAKKRSQEIRAENFTVRVIESYRDVSEEVLQVVKNGMSSVQRTKAIERKKKEIEIQVEKKYPGRRAEVAEMFIGKTYVLFVYAYIKDIRLVYAPPRSIGEFGGEIDNWMWPRHTGDFSFLRAYTAPDGSFSDYSPTNVPYHPKKYLPVAPMGVRDNDFVFILGYPGRTYRHRTSYFLSFEEEIHKPYLIKLYGGMIKILEKLSKEDRSIEIKLSPRLNSLWNRIKRNRGQLKGMKKLKLVEKRKREEKILQQFINSEANRKKKYGSLLSQFKKHFEEKRRDAQFDILMEHFFKSTTLLKNAFIIYEGSIEKRKKDTERVSKYMNKNLPQTRQRMKTDLRNFYMPADKILLKEILTRAAQLDTRYLKLIPAVENIIKATQNHEKAINSFIEELYTKTRLTDESYMMKLLNSSTKELDRLDEPFIKLASTLYPTYWQYQEKKKSQKGFLDRLLSQLIDVKKEFAGKKFIPDANGTLRLTYGHIRGYSPADALYYYPFTTLKGVIEKNTGKSPFIVPEKMIDLYKVKEFGHFSHPDIKEVPVAMLYNTDTTGGNSGSPVLNAKGKLVGINFDRVYEATINDFAWDESYSRSMGVNIQYILWFLDKFGEAHSLLAEMNVTK